MLKSAFSELQCCRGQYVRLPVLSAKSAKFRKILRKFKLIAVQGHRYWCQSIAHMQLPISH